MITKEQANELRRLREEIRKAEVYFYQCDTYYVKLALEGAFSAAVDFEEYLESLTEE